MTFDEAVAYMDALRYLGIKLGNDRFLALLARLGAPHRKFRVVHVAGTKGKGSTTAMVAAGLRSAGYHVGGYYSPYVFDLRERVQIDCEMIERERFADLVSRVAPHVDALAHGPHGHATEFEMKTAVAFLHFAEEAVSHAAVEVGIGGRLDATNVVAPAACVITNIGLDHTQLLGDTHAAIATEKAGIIKPGVPVVTATDEASALGVIAATARENGSPLRLVRAADGPVGPPGAQIVVERRSTGIRIYTDRGTYAIPPLRLHGRFQHLNAACAIAAIEDMSSSEGRPPDMDAVCAGVASAWLPGRMQIVAGPPKVLLDGAHNGIAARTLVAEISRIPHRRTILVVGMVQGHAVEEVVGPMAAIADRVIATSPRNSRAATADEVARSARQVCAAVEIVEGPMAAARRALEAADPEDLVVISGSFYTVGEIDIPALFAG